MPDGSQPRDGGPERGPPRRPRARPAAASAPSQSLRDAAGTSASSKVGSERGFGKNLRRELPAIIASILVHGTLVVVLAALTLTSTSAERETTIFSEWAPPVPEGGGGDSGPVRIDVSLVRSTADAIPIAPVSTGTGSGPPGVRAVGVAGVLGGRGGGEAAAVESIPRDDPTRKAVSQALQWIVRQQQADGRWQLTGPYANPGTIDTDAGATALALLALVGDGHTHRAGRHQKAVAKGVQWLKDQQRANGDLFDGQEEGLEAHFYSHAMGTIALCEILALSNDDELRPAAEKAVQFLIDSQNPVNGGWKYRPLTETGIGDLSVTGWALMALHTGRMAQIEVPDQAYMTASRFLDSVQESPGQAAMYRYRPDEPPQAAQRWSMTAEGLLCRQWLGWPADYPPLAEGVEFLVSMINEPVWEPDRRNVYAWYYTAQVLHNLGGDRWNEWFGRTSRLLIDHQDSAGSWNPVRPKGAFLEWSHGAGRLYFTVICTLILETPSRHRPVYAEPAR